MRYCVIMKVSKRQTSALDDVRVIACNYSEATSVCTNGAVLVFGFEKTYQYY
jgi:hypothetical protein